MADSSRLEDLRRRVEKDPASIAFAQLAEEYRRAGQYAESVAACRAGLATHPGYLSARVTLGRVLIELGQLDEAQQELETVLKSASENLAAIRGLGEIFHKRGQLPEALAQFRAALALAKNDPDLEQTVSDLAAKVQPQPRAVPKDALSLADMGQMFRSRPAPAPAPTPTPTPAPIARLKDTRTAIRLPAATPAVAEPPKPSEPPAPLELLEPVEPLEALEPIEAFSPESARTLRVVAALEQFLVAIHAARSEQRA